MSNEQEWRAAYAFNTDGMRVYDEIFVSRLFDAWTSLLLDEVGVNPGEHIVDIATGPGTVARQAAARAGSSGRVTACDLSPTMLAIARAKPPIPHAAPIEYVECPADALGVPDLSADVIVCQQGFQFFPDRPAALTEMRRVGRRGTCVGIAVWAAIDESPPRGHRGSGRGSARRRCRRPVPRRPVGLLGRRKSPSDHARRGAHLG